GVGALLASFMYRGQVFRETFRYSVQGLALYPVFLTAVRFPSWGPMRVLNLRFMKYLGSISYSLYLVHHVILIAVERRLPNPQINGPLALAIAIAVSSAIWFLIERPFANLRKRLTHVRATPQPVPEASS
ncbi:MAG TPA: acyltransferase family protein, partial [Polyangiaceae bacterium]|nr:acyltransferase family protein [Polyangiaceae bacterium]